MSAKPELPNWSRLIAEATSDGRYDCRQGR
jgi:hypothetical protein